MCELLDAVKELNLLEVTQGLNRSFQILEALNIVGSQSDLHVEAKGNIRLINNRVVKLMESLASIEAKYSKEQCAEKPA